MDGETISHYHLLKKLGSGGMGVVYSAEDTKLGRKVALKFLSTQYSRDPIALHRFEREARAASALNHPNICTIYEIDEYEGHRFIAMELLKGVTLRDRIAGEPMPRAELLDYAIQITNGLEAAHAEGIVHRDIKPANIFVTSQGYVKVLDFGLAKLTWEPTKAAASAAASATTLDVIVDEHVTTPGVPLGTVAYMSPEQAQGETLDGRTDLFSFGAVLYEMATGRHAFMGNTSEGVVDAILHKNPLPVVRFNPDIAPELLAIINKALEKDRKLRYQTASDLRADLQRVKRDSDPSRAAAVTTDASEGTVGAPPPVSEKKEVKAERRLPPARASRLSRRDAGEKAAPDRSRARAIGAVALAIILTIAGVTWWRVTRNRTTDAYLNIQSKPGAQVIVDDKSIGIVAPDGTLAVKIKSGSHRVQVRAEGYEAASKAITVKAGEHLPVQVIDLQQTAGAADIKTSLKECRMIEALLDNRRKEATEDVPANDPYAAAGKACDQLKSAVANSNPDQIQPAAAELRDILAQLGLPPASPQEQLAAAEKYALFYKLPDLARRAFNAGEIDKAEAYSRQLLQLAPEYKNNWNYGNAIFYGNFVLGRVALRRNNVVEAGQYLLAAGATPGSPQLDSFGPGMALAKELLDKGQTSVVLQYFALCKKFWKMDRGRLDEWSAIVRSGKMPDFGANLTLR